MAEVCCLDDSGEGYKVMCRVKQFTLRSSAKPKTDALANRGRLWRWVRI